jgi:hypothetical protein
LPLPEWEAERLIPKKGNIRETIGDAVLRAVVLKSLADILRKHDVQVGSAGIKRLAMPLLSNPALVRALNYHAANSKELPTSFPSDVDAAQKCNGDAIELVVGIRFVEEGLDSASRLISMLLAPALEAASKLCVERRLSQSSAGEHSVERLKEIERMLRPIVGENGTADFLACLHPQNQPPQNLREEGAITPPGVYRNAMSWLKASYETPGTSHLFTKLVAEASAPKDSYSRAIGEAAFQLCLKLFYVQSVPNYQAEDGPLTCHESHRLWEQVTQWKDIGLREFLPLIPLDEIEPSKFSVGQTGNREMLWALFGDLFRTGLLQVGVQLFARQRKFDEAFFKQLTPQHRYAPQPGRGLIRVGDAFPADIYNKLGFAHLDPTRPDNKGLGAPERGWAAEIAESRLKKRAYRRQQQKKKR